MILTTFVAMTLFTQRLDQPIKPPAELSKGVLNGLEMTNGGIKVANNVRFINWRDSKRAVTFKFSSFSPTRTKMTAVVWGFGVPNSPPAVGGKPVPPKTGKEVGRIVTIQELGTWSGTKEFVLDTATFGPTLKKPAGFILISSSGGDPTANALKAAAEAQRKQNESEALIQIGQKGYMEYVVQVVGSDGSASTTQTIRYGEPAPGPGDTTLQVQTVRPTAEFPDPKWGNSINFDGNSVSSTYRWTTKAKASKAIVQVVRGRIGTGWALWDDPGKEVLRKSIMVPPVNRGLEFVLDLSDLKKEKADSTFTVRVVPLTQGSDLAGVPSNPITITRTASATPVPAQTPKMTFDVQLVGWEPGYLGTPDDQFRYVVYEARNDELFAKLKKLYGRDMQVGDKVFLPPKPPQKEATWYEKAKATIKEILSIKGFINSMESLAAIFVDLAAKTVAQLPFTIAKKLGADPETVDTAMEVALYPMRIKDNMATMTTRIHQGKEALAEKFLDKMGVQDPTARTAMKGNVEGAISQWADDNKYPVVDPNKYTGLGPDPDYLKRPGVAYIRITAKANVPVPIGYREQPPNVTLNIGAMSRNVELLGSKEQFYPLYELSASPPTLAPGQSLVLVLPMRYHWTHDSKYSDWLFGINHVISTHYNLNGKTTIGQSLNNPWGDRDGK